MVQVQPKIFYFSITWGNEFLFYTYGSTGDLSYWQHD
jgi:hypothetical protein